MNSSQKQNPPQNQLHNSDEMSLVSSSTQEKSTTTMEPLLVYCRIKPTNLPTEEQCVKVLSDTIVQLDIPESFHQEYTFKRIFTVKSTQKEVFDEVALPLVNQLVNGKNGLLFTYGVTGSGKTYTMTGNRTEAGVMQRCFDVLFNSIQDLQAQRFVFKPDKVNGFVVQDEEAARREREEWSRKNTNKLRKRESQEDLLSARSKDSTKIIIREEDNAYAVFITYIEVYNNYVYDLLDHLVDANIYSRPQPKLVREDSSGNMYMHGIAEIEVKSAEEAFEILRKGQRRKRMAHTVLNADSSRSHSIFTIRLVQAPLVSNGETVTRDTTKFCVNQLSLVDLAGSERTSRTKNTGQRLCEAGKINQSLMVLRKCLESLRENQINGTNSMVPYREQKITMLFKNFFEGDGDIRMILCINPSMSDAEENLLVLQFAEVSQDITTKSTSLKIGSGLTSEQRKANETSNESMEKLNEAEVTQEENADPVERRSKNRKVSHEFGEFPNIDDYSDEEDFRRNLIDHLEERILHIEIFKTDIANKTSKFKALLARYAKNNSIEVKRKRDPLSVKIENELSKTNIAGKTGARRQELTKPRKIARKTSLETKTIH